MSSQSKMQLLLALVLIAAFLMVVVVPVLVAPMLDHIQVKAVERMERFTAEGEMQKARMISHGPTMLAWTYPMWGFLSVLAGIIIFIVAKPFYNGERWARGLILFCLAIPAIGGSYMFVPWINFVGSAEGGISPAIPIVLIGLIPYFAILLTGEEGTMKKIILVTVFALLGIVASYVFSNGTSAHRILAIHPMMPRYAEGIIVLQLARMAWLGVIGLMVSIYFLYMRQLAGWYLAQIGAAVCMVASLATYYWRHDTIDYLASGLLALLLLGMLIVPAVKKELLREISEKS